MAKANQSNAAKTAHPSVTQTALAALLLTVIGGGGGAFLGFTLSAPAPAGQSTAMESAPPGVADKHAGSREARKNRGGADGAAQKTMEATSLEVKELPPIVTNLAQPDTSWIRLQAAIVYDPRELQQAEKLVVELMADVTAFLRTASISSLEGAEGLRRLQEELSDRAAIRSERRVREFIIETMVVQ